MYFDIAFLFNLFNLLLFPCKVSLCLQKTWNSKPIAFFRTVVLLNKSFVKVTYGKTWTLDLDFDG